MSLHITAETRKTNDSNIVYDLTELDDHGCHDLEFGYVVAGEELFYVKSRSLEMDKLTLISGTLFMAADVFAIVSLAMPDWIITDVGGDTRLGLMWTCITLYNRPQICFTPDLQPEWLLALVCIFVGCICITTTIILLASSHWDRNVVPYARWVGFTAMVLFCLAAVIFPMGFHVDEIGGQPYQLPNSHQVGVSYILFVLALWITVISELFAGKVCLPHF